ncbi:MAG TPA: hypothetical protein VHA30_02685 [Patescibacteria group bacterium]|nr:hypothetical protein [Patescibacteria group bacterium]
MEKTYALKFSPAEDFLKIGRIKVTINGLAYSCAVTGRQDGPNGTIAVYLIIDYGINGISLVGTCLFGYLCPESGKGLCRKVSSYTHHLPADPLCQQLAAELQNQLPQNRAYGHGV